MSADRRRGDARAAVQAQGLRLGYDGRAVIEGLDLDIASEQVSVIIGANACGKSTLLRGLARLLRPGGGSVLLDGRAIHTMRTREVAQHLGVLPQTHVAPEGLTVIDLVGQGRAPHQRWWRQWSSDDQDAIDHALEVTAMAEHAHRPVDELSGGQRQRAWIAMTLAQGTPVLLLDEPTTYLDPAHQVEVLDLVVDLNRDQGRTVVMVLHDLNHACRYADTLIAMRAGDVVAEGPPGEVVDAELIEHVFGLRSRVVTDPVSHTPLVIPYGRHHPHPTEVEEHPACLPTTTR